MCAQPGAVARAGWVETVISDAPDRSSSMDHLVAAQGNGSVVDGGRATDLPLVRLFVRQVAKIEAVAGSRAAFHALACLELLVGVAWDINSHKAPKSIGKG